METTIYIYIYRERSLGFGQAKFVCEHQQPMCVLAVAHIWIVWIPNISTQALW